MDTIGDLLKRLSEGKLTSGEKSFLLDWIRNNRQEWSSSLYEDYRAAIDKNQHFLSDEKSKDILEIIRKQITDLETGRSGYLPETGTAAGHTRVLKRVWLYSGIAASVLLVLSFMYFTGQEKREFDGATEARSLIHDTAEKVVANTYDQIMPVALPDGSTVLLYPSSKISFPSSFKDSRKLTLWGKAFFEIVKQPQTPFLVYSEEMVTKVLGTSFLINAFDGEPHFSVTVKTGKVAVSAVPEGDQENKVPLAEVNLIANEQIAFDRQTRRFVSVGAVPLPPAEDPVPRLPEVYRFKETPVTEIFATLRRDYSIEINVDELALSDCSLTTTLKDKPLFEKLKIICEGIGPGTSFTMENGRVTVNTLGCNY